MALRKCACIDTLYTELDWLDRFQAAKDDGFEAVEFWDWRIRDLDATREAAQKAGIAISGFNIWRKMRKKVQTILWSIRRTRSRISLISSSRLTRQRRLAQPA